jgi:uncharacterized metal-binding protein
LGSQPVEDHFILLGQICLIYYFLFFIFMVPVLSFYEDFLIFNSKLINSQYSKNINFYYYTEKLKKFIGYDYANLLF